MLQIGSQKPINFLPAKAKMAQPLAQLAFQGGTGFRNFYNTGDVDTFERQNDDKKAIRTDCPHNHDQMRTARSLYQEAEEERKNFKFFLDRYFIDMVADERHPNRPISALITNVKSTESIYDKIQPKKCEDCPDDIKTKKAIKEQLNDIVRGRIILNKGLSKEGDAVIDGLMKAVKENKAKILEIKHYRPDNKRNRKELEYTTDGKIEKLAETIRKTNSALTTKFEEKNTGYLAVHVIFELESGFNGELQILGANVARLKDIEDICYKIRHNKTKRLDPAFQPVIDAMAKVKEDKALINEYNNYTREAYRHERLKGKGKGAILNSEFLSLESKNLPKILDFNEIARIQETVERAAVKETSL